MVILSISSPREIGARMWIGSQAVGCGAGAGLQALNYSRNAPAVPHPLHHLIPVSTLLAEQNIEGYQKVVSSSPQRHSGTFWTEPRWSCSFPCYMSNSGICCYHQIAICDDCCVFKKVLWLLNLQFAVFPAGVSLLDLTLFARSLKPERLFVNTQNFLHRLELSF